MPYFWKSTPKRACFVNFHIIQSVIKMCGQKALKVPGLMFPKRKHRIRVK